MKDACQLCPNPQNLPPHKKKRKKERTIRKNKNRSQKKHAIKTLKVNTTTSGNSEHGHEPSSNCLQLHSAAAPPESQPKGGYLNSVTDQSPPTLCTDSVEDKKQKPNSKQQELTYLHHNNSNKTETTKFFTSVPNHDQN
jgi:hypothetical protein